MDDADRLTLATERTPSGGSIGAQLWGGGGMIRSAAASLFLLGLSATSRASEGFASQMFGLASERSPGMVAVFEDATDYHSATESRILIVNLKPLWVVDTIGARGEEDFIRSILGVGDLDAGGMDDVIVRHRRGVAIYGATDGVKFGEKLFMPLQSVLRAVVLRGKEGREIALLRVLADDCTEAQAGATFSYDMNQFTIEFFDKRGDPTRQPIRVESKGLPHIAVRAGLAEDDLIITRAQEDENGDCWLSLELMTMGESRKYRLEALPAGVRGVPLQVLPMNDVDGDGEDELAIIYSPFLKAFAPAGEFRGSIVSLAKGELYPIKASVCGDGHNVGDLNMDGADDLIIAGSGGVYCSVVAISGKDGTQLFANEIKHFDCVGSGVARIGDYDGDGVDDLAVSSGDPHGADYGALYVMSARTGKILERWEDL